jgi:hypothetical protein
MASTKLYVNLDKRPGKNNLGVLDTADECFDIQIQRLRNEFSSKIIEDYVSKLFKESGFTPKKESKEELLSMLKTYSKSENIHELIHLEPFNLKIKDNCLYSIYDIAEYYSKYIEKKFFFNLANIQIRGYPTIGKGEGILALFTHYRKTNNGADLIDKASKVRVELKGEKGVLYSPGHIKHSTDCIKQLKKLFSSYNIILPVEDEFPVSNELIKLIFKQINNYEMTIDDKFVREFIQSFRCYENVKTTKDHIKLFKKCIKDSDIEYLKVLLTSIHLEEYIKHSRLDYIFFFDKDYVNFLPKKVKGIVYNSLVKFINTNIKCYLGWNSKSPIARAFMVGLKIKNDEVL